MLGGGTPSTFEGGVSARILVTSLHSFVLERNSGGSKQKLKLLLIH